MDPLEYLRSEIPNFPGYAEEDARRLSDEEVRSYLGEALADLEVRMAPLDDAIATQIGDLLIRVGFTNQAVFHVYENASRTQTDFGMVAAADAHVVEVADRASSVELADLPAYLDEIVAAFDRRDAVMGGAASAAP